MQEPSACFDTPVSSATARNSSGARPDGRFIRQSSSNSGKRGANLEQIALDWNRFAIPIKRVNLLYLFDVERIHAIGRKRPALPANRDPLGTLLRAGSKRARR
jgi:hypothetical protein